MAVRSMLTREQGLIEADLTGEWLRKCGASLDCCRWGRFYCNNCPHQIPPELANMGTVASSVVNCAQTVMASEYVLCGQLMHCGSLASGM